MTYSTCFCNTYDCYALYYAVRDVCALKKFYFLQGHRELFNDEALSPFLEGVNVRTDEQRIQEVIVKSKHWIFFGLKQFYNILSKNCTCIMITLRQINLH